MKETEKLKLKKPDPEDFYNVEDFNGNMDALDADQVRQDEAIVQAQRQLDAAREALAAAAQRLATAEQAIAGHTAAIQGHAGNATIHVTQAEKDGWNGKVPSTRKVNDKALSGDISLTAADVGALGKTETAAAATKLATSRTIRTNLASTSSSSFNGTANITPGVTGILPVANGGTGSSTEKYLKLAGGTMQGNIFIGHNISSPGAYNPGFVFIGNNMSSGVGNVSIKFGGTSDTAFPRPVILRGVANPTASTDAANKGYVDSFIFLPTDKRKEIIFTKGLSKYTGYTPPSGQMFLQFAKSQIDDPNANHLESNAVYLVLFQYRPGSSSGMGWSTFAINIDVTSPNPRYALVTLVDAEFSGYIDAAHMRVVYHKLYNLTQP